MSKSYVASGKTVDEAIDLACELANASIEEVEIEILELGGRGLFGLGHRDARVRVTVEAKEPEKPQDIPTTFGKKKSKRELWSKKKAPAEIEIAPIVVIEPGSPLPSEKPARPAPAAKGAKADAVPTKKGAVGDKPAASEAIRESRAMHLSEGQLADEVFARAQDFLLPIFAAMGVTPSCTTSIKDGILWIIISGERLGILIGRRGETLNALQYLVNLAINRRSSSRVRIVLDVEGYRESREKTLHFLARKMAEKAVRSGRRVELEPMNPHERRIVHMALQNDKRVDTSSHGEEPYRRVVVSSRHRRSRTRPDHQRRERQDSGNETGN
jgi:spoIIIJ-associated protein